MGIRYKWVGFIVQPIFIKIVAEKLCHNKKKLYLCTKIPNKHLNRNDIYDKKHSPE